MKILLASSEVHPYSKTGGLADMVGSLGKALAQAGQRVGIVTPLYQGIRERFANLRQVGPPLDLELGVRRIPGEVWALEPAMGLTIYFVDQPEFYQRSGLYQKDGVDYPDNGERFLFLAKAVAHLAVHLDWKPDLLHLNDWQVGFAALFLHHQRKSAGGGSCTPHLRDHPQSCVSRSISGLSVCPHQFTLGLLLPGGSRILWTDELPQGWHLLCRRAHNG